MPGVQVVDIETTLGLARAHVTPGAGAGTLVLGHGAGGGVQAPDLLAVTAAAAASPKPPKPPAPPRDPDDNG